jgi:hypothetical protein
VREKGVIMQATITLRADVFQKVKQLVRLTHFNTVEDFIAYLIEEKSQEMSLRNNDPIVQLRGKLKGKTGGTALFMKDKQADIDKEYRV